MAEGVQVDMIYLRVLYVFAHYEFGKEICMRVFANIDVFVH